MIGTTGRPLPPGWCWASLDDLANLLAGNPAPQRKDNFAESGPPFVRVQDMGRLGMRMGLADTKDHLAENVAKGLRLFPAGSVLFTKSGASTLLNQRAVLQRPMYVVSHIAIAIPENGILSEWLYYWLSTVDFSHYAHATTLPSLPFSKIKQIAVPVAPTVEQTRIADTLDELFSDLNAGVAALERARDKLKLYRAAVLKTAVEGALTADWRESHPDAEPAGELLKRILVERRRRWEEDQLRKFEEKGKTLPKNWKAKYKEPVAPDTTSLPPLPVGWCLATVDQLSEIRSGQTPKDIPIIPDELGTVVWFRVNDMNNPRNKCRMADGGLRMKSSLAEELNLKLFPRGTIVFPKRGGAIRTNKKRLLAFPAACDLNIMALIPAAEVSKYLWQWFQGLDLAKLSDGSNVPQINHPHIAPCLIPLAPVAEQEAIVAAVQAQLSVVEQLEADIDAKLQSAQALRQSILKHVFTGKLVPQDPDDEPASELLHRIAAERKARVQEAAAAKRRRLASRRSRK